MTAQVAPSLDRDPRQITSAELHRLLTADDEVALLDVREEYDYAKGHILLATLLPLSRLELRISALVPRLATPIVLCDGSDGILATQAAETLAELGYSDLAVLTGGVRAWRADGRQIFTTTHVLAKTFGGTAERAYGTPRITAHELKRKLDGGEDVAIFDARTLAEFQAGSIPGASSCPLAELPYRVPAAVPSPNTLVVINCASRTRGILGAQSLLNAGIPNPVAVLENGVMAWSLAGSAVVTDSKRVTPAPGATWTQSVREAARSLAKRYHVRSIERATLRRFRNDANRSLYVFDVRTPEAFEAGHIKGTQSAPGGQLIMTLLQYVATHRARLVLVDDGDGLRATVTAAWLAQIGRHEVFVLTDPPPEALSYLRETTHDPPRLRPVEWVDPPTAKVMLDAGTAIMIDLESSISYLERHIPGSYFAIRSRLPAGLGDIDRGKAIIFTSSDGTLAGLAARELSEHGPRNALALKGGTAQWINQGFPVETTDRNQLHPFEDLWQSPMRATERQSEAFQAYLDWEMSLADQVLRDATIEFAGLRACGNTEPYVEGS